MSKRDHDGQNQLGDDNKRSRRRKHLYLVLDDWSNGFSIHMIDADTIYSDSHDSTGINAVAGYLPEPALLRLASPIGPLPHACMFFSALGTKIFAFMNQRCALVYNPETAETAIGPHTPARMPCGFGITVISGEKLYVLSYRFLEKEHSFEVMSWAPTAPDAMQRPSEGWSRKTLPAPPPTFTTRQRVTSYALHPDGYTIFMTTANRDTPCRRLGTYYFNTKSSEWRWHGEWALPFLDRGYFDSELDAWVGLHEDGYICSCQVASRSAPGIRKLDWQTTREKLFYKDRDTHMRASLTYLGRSKFCLVESVVREGVGFDTEHALGDHHGCVLHVTMFGLGYTHRGELQTTNQNSTRSYLVSRHHSHFSPLVFWI
ncbi:hypothetical protein QOZ80_8AG0632610 [Eleusine coracana subsp. coracana]|nr:hypothetical protein QOZ80_8AG0632610 [Eleusine coracana subsp. coracana]